MRMAAYAYAARCAGSPGTSRTRADWSLVENIGRRSLGSSGGVERDMDTGTIAEAITKAVARDGPDPNENMRLAFEL